MSADMMARNAGQAAAKSPAARPLRVAHRLAKSSSAARASASALSHIGVRTKANRGGTGGASAARRGNGDAYGRLSGSAASWPASTSRISAQIVERAREDADMIERARQDQRAGARNQAVARFDAKHAAKRRRADHRAVGLRTDRQRHHAGRHRRRRTRGRAAGRARQVARIARLAGVEIGELGGHRLADDDRAGRAQPRHRGAVARPAGGPRAAASRIRSDSRRYRRYP